MNYTNYKVGNLFVVILLMMIPLLSSCYTWIPPKQLVNPQNTRVYDKPFDKVWSSIVSYIGENGIPIKLMEKESGYISTEHSLFANSNTNYCDCGYFKNPDEEYYIFKKFGATMNVNIVVKKLDDSKVKVTCNTFYKGQPKSVVGVKDYYEKCESTGVFEKMLLDNIE
jgi:hypothetical protein